jgi:hypothetical protein
MNAWLGVVSAEHVAIGVAQNMAQTNHGKRTGLARMSPGDWLVYYSPQQRLGEPASVRAFTAIGVVADGEPWQADLGQWHPWRRRVDYLADARPVQLDDVRSGLALCAGPNWGYRLRRGLLPLELSDVAVIHQAMTGRPLPGRAQAGGPGRAASCAAGSTLW